MPEEEQIAEGVLSGAVPPGELLPRVLRNTVWMFNSSVLIRALSLVRNIFLARLLLPEDFGVFGLASAVVGFGAMLSDVGAGAFLIYTHDDAEEHADSAFWLNLGVATLLASGLAGVAPLMGRSYARADLVPVLVVLAVAFWLQSISAVHGNLLRRELRFRSLAVIDAIVGIASFVAALALAWRGYRVWALVLPVLLGNAVRLLLVGYVSRWLPAVRVCRRSLTAVTGFSRWYLGSAVMWYVVQNMDNVLVGKFLGMTALGIYVLAYNYALLPLTVFANPLGNVSLPELARLRLTLPRFWRAFHQISRLLVAMVCPIAGAMIIAAPDLFPIVFGSKWNGAILPFQVLTAYCVVRGLWADPFAALARFDSGTRVALATSVLGVLAIYGGLRYGLPGVAWAVLLVVGGAHVWALYSASGSVRRVAAGLQHAAPYLMVTVLAMLLAVGVRYICVQLIGDSEEFLGLATVATVFAVYGTVFRQRLARLTLGAASAGGMWGLVARKIP